jgi:HSP20 family protein
MAETRTPQSQSQQGGQAIARPESQRRDVRRWDADFGPLASPFQLFDRLAEEMDRAFDRMWRDVGRPRGSWLSRVSGAGQHGIWSPRVEAFHKGDQFVVRAELPGLRKDDVQVDLRDDFLTIRGERHEEHEEHREGYLHSEREYGQFYRTIPLPEGVIAESADASFRDGVLEVTMKAPPAEATRGRRIEVKDSPEKK